MNPDWLEVLREQVEARGQAETARELEVSRSTVSLVLSGKYPGGTERIAARVLRIYPEGGEISCPVLGGVSAGMCATNRELAKAVGRRAGNPETLRLRLACLSCEIRK